MKNKIFITQLGSESQRDAEAHQDKLDRWFNKNPIITILGITTTCGTNFFTHIFYTEK